MMDIIFNACVEFLLDLAKWTGLTYKEVNVIIFCFAWPVWTIYLVWQVRRLRNRLKALEEKKRDIPAKS